MKQELELKRESALNIQDEIQLEATRQATDWAQKLKEKYPREKVATAFREAAEEVENQ